MVTLNKRQVEIINYLEKAIEWITIDNISKVFDVSQRTIRNDLDSIIAVLNKYDINIEKKPKVGIKLILKKNQNVKEIIKAYDGKIYNCEERALMILIILLIKEKSTIDELADLIKVSKNTLVNDLKLAEEKLNYFDIKLMKKSYKGIMVEESYKKLSDTFLKVFRLLSEAQHKDVYKLLYSYSNITEENIKRILEIIEEKNKVQYLEESLEELEKALLFALSKRNTKEELIELDIDEKEVIILSEAIKSITNKTLNYEKLSYLSTILKGSKRNSFVEGIGDKEHIKKITTEIVNQLCKVINIDANSDIEFIRQMEMHLSVAIYRLQNNLIIDNPMLEEIKYKMSFIYDITEKVLKSKRDIIGLDFPQSEIAYITMYFGALFEKHVKGNLNANVIIVCNGGFATSSLLKSRIDLMLPELKVQSICTMRDIENNLQRHKVDFVISTVPLKLNKHKVVKVNPLLGLSDCEKIKAEIYNKWYEKNCKYLIDKVKDNEVHGIARIIPEEYMQFDLDIEDWRQAIEIAAKPLVDNKKIKKAYVNDMIRAIEKLGNYMVFIPEVAFVHAPPENVLETSVSYLNLKTNIDFGSKKKVDVKTIVVLANKEESKNLIDIVNILTKDNNLEKFKNATKHVDLVELI